MPNLTGTAIRLLALLLMAGDAGDKTTSTPGSQRSIDGDGVPFLVSVGLADVVGRTERRTRMGLLLPREESDGLVKVGGRDVIITGILRGLWAPARQPRWVGRWSATPATHAALQAVLFRRVSLLGRSRCKQSDVKVVKRDEYTALATMVAHDRVTMSSVTQVQAEHLKCQQFMKPRTTCRELMST